MRYIRLLFEILLVSGFLAAAGYAQAGAPAAPAAPAVATFVAAILSRESRHTRLS